MSVIVNICVRTNDPKNYQYVNSQFKPINNSTVYVILKFHLF